MIGQFLRSIWDFFIRLINRVLNYLADLFGSLFQQLLDVLKWLFRPVFFVIALILYVVYKIAELAVTLIQVFLALGRLFFAFVSGIFRTLAGFTYTPTARSDGAWTSVFREVVAGLETYQLDTLAYVLMFCVWFATGFAAIRIISSIRSGGD